MSKLVVVAIPAQNDEVWNVSSERVPHLTLMYLGDAGSNPNIPDIENFVKQMTGRHLMPFSLRVDHHGVLGDDHARVLFFSNVIHPWLRRFRMALLDDTNVRNAYHSVQQFAEWTPHLTLGYPDSPSKALGLDIEYVTFDRVAVWSGDYSGPEFDLAEGVLDGVSAAELSHHGIKGMRWGVRRKAIGSDQEVVVRTTPSKFSKKNKIKTTGGKSLPPSDDAVRSAINSQKAKKSGTTALSNKELQDLVTRMNLEQQFSRLQANPPDTAVRRLVRDLLEDSGGQSMKKVAADVAIRQVGTALVRQAPLRFDSRTGRMS